MPQDPPAETTNEKAPETKFKVDVSSLLKPVPAIELLNESKEEIEKLSALSKEMKLDLSQDNLLDSNLLEMNPNELNEEEDLLNLNLDDDLLNSGNQAVNLLDDPITDDELDMKFN